MDWPGGFLIAFLLVFNSHLCWSGSANLCQHQCSWTIVSPLWKSWKRQHFFSNGYAHAGSRQISWRSQPYPKHHKQFQFFVFLLGWSNSISIPRWFWIKWMYRKNEATSTLNWTLKPEISIESSRQAGFVQLTLEFRIAL